MPHPSKAKRSKWSGWTGVAIFFLQFMLGFPGAAGSVDAEVLPPGVSVRQASSAASPITAELPAGAKVGVLFTQNGPEGNWSQVVLPSGRTGFVPDHSLRRLTSPKTWRPAGPDSPRPTTTWRAGQDALDIPLRRTGGVFLVKARVNNQATTHFIVDTGASVVTISHAIADQLGLDYENRPKQKVVTASGYMDSPRVMLDSISVPDEGGAGVAHVEAYVATLPGSPPAIGGLLGQTFLRHFQVTIDAERGVMHLRPISQ